MAFLGELYGYQSNYAAAQARLGEALRLFQDLGARPWCLFATFNLGILAREQGDPATARLRLEENLALCRPEDAEWQAWSLVSLGEVMVMQEDAALAASVLEQGQVLFQKLEMGAGMAWAANHLGHVAQIQGDYDLARRRHEASLPLFRESAAQHLGNLGEAFAFQGLGETALAQGDAALAARHLHHALALFRDLGYRSGQAWCLAGLAGVATLDEEPERAAQLWGAAEAQRQAIGCRPAPAARATRERLMSAAREQLGEEAFAAAWAEGQAMTMEQAIELALQALQSRDFQGEGPV
jgi:tetratricopeptide (TPR) repeat protein